MYLVYDKVALDGVVIRDHIFEGSAFRRLPLVKSEVCCDEKSSERELRTEQTQKTNRGGYDE